MKTPDEKVPEEETLHCRTGRNCVLPDQPIGDCSCVCVDCTRANLTEIALWWAEILADRFPGTRRRWHQRRNDQLPPTHSCGTPWVFDEPITAIGRHGRANRQVTRPRCPNPACSDEEAIGFSPSPARDDVIDTVAAVTWDVIELRNSVGQRFNTGDRKVGVSDACRWIADTLPQITEPQFTRDVGRSALKIVRRVRAGTGQIEDVIQLDAACIICGQETLLAYAARMAVTCIGEECVCDLHDCGCHRGEKHIWAEDQLVWLARVLGAEEESA